ncbi:MAG TPA: hypothetical protein VK571_04790 [Gemmatimonadaceae bacterium]|nr:hypothetical protein [Gemmatimonadaceae bacterium]
MKILETKRRADVDADVLPRHPHVCHSHICVASSTDHQRAGCRQRNDANPGVIHEKQRVTARAKLNSV